MKRRPDPLYFQRPFSFWDSFQIRSVKNFSNQEDKIVLFTKDFSVVEQGLSLGELRQSIVDRVREAQKETSVKLRTRINLDMWRFKTENILSADVSVAEQEIYDKEMPLVGRYLFFPEEIIVVDGVLDQIDKESEVSSKLNENIEGAK